jgi:hypothetical protein
MGLHRLRCERARNRSEQMSSIVEAPSAPWAPGADGELDVDARQSSTRVPAASMSLHGQAF